MLSFTLSKIPDFVRALKRLIVEAGQKLRLLSKKSDSVPSPTTASHLTPPPSISKSPSSPRTIENDAPPPNQKSDSDVRSTQSPTHPPDSDVPDAPPAKPQTAPDVADNPSLKQTPELKNEGSAAKPTQAPKAKPRSAAKKKKTSKKKAEKKKKKAAKKKTPRKKKAPQKKKRSKTKTSRSKKKNKKKKKGKSKSPREKVSDEGPSGYRYVLRHDMPVRTIKVGDRDVLILGSPHSTSDTPGHDAAIEAKAEEMAKSGKYDYVLMQRSWRTATGRVSKHNKVPDVIGVRLDGKIDAYEIKSTRDTCKKLKARLKKGMNTLRKEQQGDYDVIEDFDPTAVPRQPKPEKSKNRQRKKK